MASASCDLDNFFKKILVSSTQQQILSTCFIFSDRFRLIIQTSSGSLNKIHKGTNFIPMLKSTGHVPIKV